MSVTLNDGTVCPSWDEVELELFTKEEIEKSKKRLDDTINNGCCVYMHIAPNGKRYVGITTAYRPKWRFCNGSGYNGNKYFHSDIEKYGWENIMHIICATDLDIPEACNLEMQLIREFDTTNPEKGYNLSPGGDYYKYCRQLIPEQEEMNSILCNAMTVLSDAIRELGNLIQK